MEDSIRDAWIVLCAAELQAFSPALSDEEAEQMAGDLWCDDGTVLFPADAAEREVAAWRQISTI
ncbi:MAG: hypothetical protein V4532_07740 [Pseudomonadota bacterium]